MTDDVQTAIEEFERIVDGHNGHPNLVTTSDVERARKALYEFVTVQQTAEMEETLRRLVAAEDRLSEGMRWIPVGERKPKHGTVLGVVAGRVTIVTEHPDWWGHKASLRENNGPDVTHWMPLPEAPK